jgi:hypothetical protein
MKPGVFSIKGMPLFAVRLAFILCANPFAAHTILSIGHLLEMERVDASMHLAQMVDGQIIRQRSVVEEGRKPMSQPFAMPTIIRAMAYTIAAWIHRSLPQPTRLSFEHTAPKPLL